MRQIIMSQIDMDLYEVAIEKPIKCSSKKADEIIDIWIEYCPEPLKEFLHLEKGHCMGCGCKREYMEKCHIWPKSFGGSWKWTNIHILCSPCHKDSENYSGFQYWAWLAVRVFDRASHLSHGEWWDIHMRSRRWQPSWCDYDTGEYSPEGHIRYLQNRLDGSKFVDLEISKCPVTHIQFGLGEKLYKDKKGEGTELCIGGNWGRPMIVTKQELEAEEE